MTSAKAQDTINTHQLSVSVLYTLNTLGETTSGGLLCISKDDYTFVIGESFKSTSFGSNMYYNYHLDSILTNIFSIGIGRKISSGRFITRGYITLGYLYTYTNDISKPNTLFVYIPGRVEKISEFSGPNLGIGIISEGKYVSCLIGVETNAVFGTSITIGLGLNTNSF